MAANSQQMEEMATFDIGRSLISYEGLQRPFTMQTHEWCGKWPGKIFTNIYSSEYFDGGPLKHNTCNLQALYDEVYDLLEKMSNYHWVSGSSL